MNPKERLITAEPANTLMKQHIMKYYFHQSFDEEYSKNILYHPHHCVAINSYRNSRLEWDEKGRTYVSCEQEDPFIAMTISTKHSKEVKLRGAFDKIGILFKPLGINHFLEEPLVNYVKDRITIFDYFGEPFIEVLKKAHTAESIEERRNMLDAFFLSRYLGFKEVRLVKAVSIMLNTVENVKIQDLARTLEVSRETLLRLFKKHLCCSIAEFKSVVRFRRALDFYQQSQEKPKLTEVALDSKYYDQSDFIRHFKMVTGFNPKSFFSSIHDIGNTGTYWSYND